jgi:hypothetical protein
MGIYFMVNEMRYPGNELEIFADCKRWKSYWVSILAGFLSMDYKLVEIGSGIGSNYPYLTKISEDYLGIEPDANLTGIAKEKYPEGTFKEGLVTSFSEISVRKKIAFLYIDVLEHILDDSKEMHQALSKMNIGDCLVVLVPAHQYLYSPFDKLVGHHRRYSSKQLRSMNLSGMQIKYLQELDFIGFLAGLINAKLIKSKNASTLAIGIWDSLIPLSRKIDRIFKILPGKSILCIWEKNGDPNA